MIDFRRSRLDRGGGKDLSLHECPREQLEKEVRSRAISVIHDISNAMLIAALLRLENYVSEIPPSLFTDCSETPVTDISPLNNVGGSFLGQGRL